MKLQISFDSTDLQKTVKIAESIAQYADTLEIDTSLIYKYGIEVIKEFQTHFPKHALVADAKIINHTPDTIPLFANAGAHWITVMAGASMSSIRNACSTAHNLRAKIMLDLSDSISVAQSALEAKNIGVDALIFNHPYNIEDPFNFTEKWEMIHGNTDLPIFIDANISLSNIEPILKLKPAGIIIGNSITQAEDPAQAAKMFFDMVKSPATQ